LQPRVIKIESRKKNNQSKEGIEDDIERGSIENIEV
jgi:hypothetical protein